MCFAIVRVFIIIIAILSSERAAVDGFGMLRYIINIDRYHTQTQRRKPSMICATNGVTRESNNPPLDDADGLSRRQLLHQFLTVGIGAAASMSTLMNEPANAVEQPKPEDTIWLTGKMPNIPGQKPKDKSDVTGTKKDPNFLRSLSDCKNQCENMTGATNSNSGYAKGKDECLSECQDICCTTYQQCTFPIVQRI